MGSWARYWAHWHAAVVWMFACSKLDRTTRWSRRIWYRMERQKSGNTNEAVGRAGMSDPAEDDSRAVYIL